MGEPTPAPTISSSPHAGPDVAADAEPVAAADRLPGAHARPDAGAVALADDRADGRAHARADGGAVGGADLRHVPRRAEIRFDGRIMQERGYFHHLPDGRRRHGRRLASTTINSTPSSRS